MDKAVSAADANRRFSELLRTVKKGQSVVVTSHGKPVALYDARSRGAEAYFELAAEYMERNKIPNPRAEARKAAAAEAAAKGTKTVRFWPYG